MYKNQQPAPILKALKCIAAHEYSEVSDKMSCLSYFVIGWDMVTMSHLLLFQINGLPIFACHGSFRAFFAGLQNTMNVLILLLTISTM